MSLQTIKSNNNLYANILIISPDGKEMFRCGRKRAEWYLKKNIAEMINGNPYQIKLKFKPKGNGNNGDKFYLGEKRNICVVCGSKKELTKHHVVPYEFKKLFPIEIKSHSSHDVLLTCKKCHEIYNKKCIIFLKKLKKAYSKHNINTNFENEHYKKKSKAFAAAKTILEHGDKIPSNRIEYLKCLIKEYVNKDFITEKTIKRVAKIKIKPNNRTKKYTNPFAYKIVNHYGPEELSIMWRNHFIETMSPSNLPTGWDINRPLGYIDIIEHA